MGGRVEARRLQLFGQRLLVAAMQVVVPGAELLREPILLLAREPECLGCLASCRTIAVGDDVGGHRRAVRAVALVHVLDDLFALIAGWQIEIDVRPLAALLGEETLEQQVPS